MKLIFDKLPLRDESVGQFEDMNIRLMMVLTGRSREECVRRRKIAAAEYRERETQESIAQNWP